MITTEHLYRQAEKMKVGVVDWEQGEFKAATIEYQKSYCIFLNKKKIEKKSEEKVVLAHELGHCKTGATHALFSPFELISKNERKADKFAVKKLISKASLKTAIHKGNTETWQLAEYFDLPEDFIIKAISIYSM